jgi:hypothetical protein
MCAGRYVIRIVHSEDDPVDAARLHSAASDHTSYYERCAGGDFKHPGWIFHNSAAEEGVFAAGKEFRGGEERESLTVGAENLPPPKSAATLRGASGY